MKISSKRAVRTGVQVVAGICAAVPVFLSTSGLPGDVGAGAVALAVATTLAKFMNLAQDELDK